MKKMIFADICLIGLAIYLGHHFVDGVASRTLTSEPLWYLIGIIVSLTLAAAITVITLFGETEYVEEDWTK